jgi:hypothetical protein
MIRIAAPAIVVMLAVMIFVAVAGWNGSGEPRLLITLTERELTLIPRGGLTATESSTVRMRIEHHYRHEPLDARNWLPESRLREIGFFFNVPIGAPQAADAYDHVPARLAWVVFEHDGPQWRDLERRSRLRDPNQVPVALMQSRLVPVDAGLDFDILRRRYPTGHLIARGEIGVAYLPAANGGPLLYGTLRGLIPHTLTVPHRFRPVLEGLTESRDSATRPRYEVELAVGTLGLTYIRSLRSLNEPSRN